MQLCVSCCEPMTEYFRHIILQPLNIFSTCCWQNTYWTLIVSMQCFHYPFNVSEDSCSATYRLRFAILILYEEHTVAARSFLLFTFAQSDTPRYFVEEVRNREVEGIVVSLSENNMGLVSRN